MCFYQLAYCNNSVFETQSIKILIGCKAFCKFLNFEVGFALNDLKLMGKRSVFKPGLEEVIINTRNTAIFQKVKISALYHTLPPSRYDGGNGLFCFKLWSGGRGGGSVL